MSNGILAEAQDLQGNALNAQRFRMLTEIAEELKEKVVFPVCFDVTISIRNALQKGLAVENLKPLLHLDPLIGAKLLRVAKSRARRHKLAPATDLAGAFAILDDEAIVRVATEMSTAQLLRSRFLADFSDWVGLLWERTLNMAATAHVIAGRFTGIAPGQAMFAALCHDLPLYYMLYRAVQYPELRARPASLKHLVINWHSGIAESLLSSLGLPRDIVSAVADEPPATPPVPPQTLGDVVQLSNLLAGPLSESIVLASPARLFEHFEAVQAEIQTFRMRLRELFSPSRGMLA